MIRLTEDHNFRRQEKREEERLRRVENEAIEERCRDDAPPAPQAEPE